MEVLKCDLNHTPNGTFKAIMTYYFIKVASNEIKYFPKNCFAN